MITSIRNFLRKPFTIPVILFLVCVFAYGIYTPWMGFYWDDWPWIWRNHIYGPGAIREIDSAFRPLAGVVLWIGVQVAGENALGWQIYNFAIRWLGGVAFWWSLRQIWSKRQEAALWGAVLFLVYPGFSQQFVSINSSRHLFPLITFILSIGFTGRAFSSKRGYWINTGAAIGLSIITMLTTEYYYGLELIRGFILWILIPTGEKGKRSILAAILKAWAPYLVPLVGIFGWRFAISQQVNYQIGLLDQMTAAPLQTTRVTLNTSLSDLLEVSLGALGRLFLFPDPEVFGPLKTMFYWGITAVITACIFIYGTLFEADPKDRRWNLQAVVIGGLALWISGLPFWTTGLAVKLTFPNDRLTLPMMIGFSLVVIALADILKPKSIKNLVLALVVGLSVGHHYQNAVSYQRDWKTVTAFFQQLTWRVPGLETGTAVLSPELPILYSTDNSLSSPLNWVYGLEEPSPNLPYGLFFLDLRLGTKVSSLEVGAPIEMDYGQGLFAGSTSQMIVLKYEPPACLRVLDPKYDRHLPGTPETMDAAMRLSDPGRYVIDVEFPAVLPEKIFGTAPSPLEKWCYYFQRADLARQFGEWDQVAALGDIAFDLDDSPNHASERVPFIEGYAHVGDWDAAVEQTLTTIEIDKLMGPMLCDTWERINQELPASEPLLEVIRTVEERLSCGIHP
jgi:hypothetical protein